MRFENVLARNGSGKHLVGGSLSLFQVVAGLRYAFPHMIKRLKPKLRRVIALHDRVMVRPRIAAYLSSDRRLRFSEDGIFRCYPEIDE